MSEITMPRLSDSMEEGTILKWLVQDGQEVAVGDELLEVETDKATVTVESELAGVLAIAVPEGATVSVGAVIATVGAGDGGRTADGGRVADPAPGNGAAPAVSSPATRPPSPALSTTPDRTSARAATPLARRAAAEHGVALDELSGSGPRGRITRADVLAAAGVAAPPAPSPHSAPSPQSAPIAAGPSPALPRPTEPGEVVELTRVQRVIAQRMTQSRMAIPEFEVQTEVRMDEALALRAQLRKLPGDPVVPSVNDLIVRAVAMALRRHPKLNASYAGDQLVLHPQVNVGIAVATEDALIVPTVRDADTRSLRSLAAEARRLADKVRAGTVTPEELSGATFTVSNLGMFGMTAIRPIINAPQVAILGVGVARETLQMVDGQPVARQLMTLTLSCDHRAVYGADAARFLSEVRDLLETPLRLLV